VKRREFRLELAESRQGVKGGLIRFYREIVGVGLVFPRADRPIAVEFPGYPVVRLRGIDGLEFVEETVTALGSSTELATHLFRQCWAEGTGSDVDLCRAFGWEVEEPTNRHRHPQMAVARRRPMDGSRWSW
jgi:hypothetical protein